MGCQALLQGIFSTQGSNPRCLLHLLHHRQVPSCWASREALPAWKVLLRGTVGEAWGCSAYLAQWSWWRAWGAWRWCRHKQSANSERSRERSHKGLVAPASVCSVSLPSLRRRKPGPRNSAVNWSRVIDVWLIYSVVLVRCTERWFSKMIQTWVSYMQADSLPSEPPGRLQFSYTYIYIYIYILYIYVFFFILFSMMVYYRILNIALCVIQ